MKTRDRSLLARIVLCSGLPIVAALGHTLPARADGWEYSGVFNPRFEVIDGEGEDERGDLARRAFFKAQSFLKKGSFGMSAEGFFERDWADTDFTGSVLGDRELGAPDLRRSRETGVLQEAYVDYQFGSIFVRAGRQPVRWSQSWTLPSLDVFTGRRFNRLFFDPTPEQLIHPDGVLVTYAGSTIEAEIFQAIQPANTILPKPLPVEDRKQEAQTGARVKARMEGFDVSLVGRVKPGETLLGAAISYALDCCVLKAEAGQSADVRGFVITGVDFFFGDLTFGPQLTWFQDPDLTGDKVETVAYAPLRYAWGKNSIELQYYKHLEKSDEFASALYSRDLSDLFKLTAYAQRYEGAAGRLFGLYKDMTGGGVIGLRLDLNVSL